VREAVLLDQILINALRVAPERDLRLDPFTMHFAGRTCLLGRASGGRGGGISTATLALFSGAEPVATLGEFAPAASLAAGSAGSFCDPRPSGLARIQQVESFTGGTVGFWGTGAFEDQQEFIGSIDKLSQVPTPGSLALMLTGVAGLFVRRRKV
jgi:hypothetical protein